MSAFDLPETAKVQPEELQQYLRSTGWIARTTRRHASCFVHELASSDTLTVEVLNDTKLGDYHTRTAEVIDVLAAFENRAASSIVQELLAPPADILRFITHSDIVDAGLIPIQQSISLREAARDSLLAAAHAVIEKRASFPTLSNSRAREFLDTCREGQTERGSYATLFVVPVAPQLSDSGFGAADPFSRMVTCTLMKALHHAALALQQGEYSGLLTGVEVGLNANLLDAISRLDPGGRESHVEVTATWSRVRTAPNISRSVRFSQSVFRTLGEASRTLKSVPPEDAATVKGRVRGLERAEHLQKWGRIVIEWQGQLVRVDLDHKHYQEAILAHKNERPVLVQGTLKRERRLTLEHVTKFKVLDSQRSLFDEE